MAKYSATVPNGAKPFTYDGKQYTAGSSLPSDDPCEMLAFVEAFRTTNPEGGKTDATPNFWQEMSKACAAGAPTPPASAPVTPPAERTTPPGEDSPGAQGAPAAPATVAGGDREAVPPGGGDDSSTAEEPQRPAEGEPHPTRSAERPAEQTGGGDPVELFTGTVYLSEVDLETPHTVLPLSLMRYYRSGPGFYGPLGWNWDHNHNLFVRELSNGDVALWRATNEERFVFSGAEFEPPRGVFEKLERVAGIPQAFDLHAAGGLRSRFERPPAWLDGERVPILYVEDRHGNRLSYRYDAADRLARVEDADGRFLQFDYDACGLLTTLTDAAGRRYAYHHDEEGQHLVCVVRPATSDHPEGTRKVYHYEPAFTPPSTRHNLLRISDSEGNVYLENEFERDPASWQYGRVVEQLYGGFLHQFRYTQLQWVPAAANNVNIHSVQTEVLNPNLGLETYTFNFRGDLLDRRYRLSADGSFRVAVWQYEYDAQGNRSKTTQPDGGEELQVYDFAHADPRMRGRLLRKELTAASGFPSPSRIVWRGNYEARYQLLSEETDESGARTRYRYDFDLTPAAPDNTGKLKQVLLPDATLPDGALQQARTELDYNARGQLTVVRLPDGTRNEYRYGAAGDEAARLVEEISDAGGLRAVQRRAYHAFGYAHETTDANGAVTRSMYNALGQVERLERPAVAGNSADERYHYDSDGHLIAVERPKGSFSGALGAPGTHLVDQFERDVLGFATLAVLSSNTDESRRIRYCNDYRGLAQRTFTPDGATLVTTFDERKLPIAEEVIGSDGLRSRSSNVYDRTGRLVRRADAFGAVTEYEYDAFGRLHSVTLPNGSQHKYEWQARDLLRSEETRGDDGTGTVRRLAQHAHAYDEKGRRISTTVQSFADDPLTSVDVVTTFYYDVLDRVTRIIANRGDEYRRQYDGLGRLVLEVDPMGNEQEYVLDAAGNLLQQISRHKEPGGVVSSFSKTFEYDARRRRTAVIESDGAVDRSSYDDRDLVVQRTDRRGVTTSAEYDSFNTKRRQVEDAGGLGIEQAWAVDVMSRTTTYTDPKGEVSHYTFDSLGRIRRIEYPNGFSSLREYDERNRVARETLGSGVVLSYTFDTANRLTRVENVTAPAPVRALGVHEFSYDGLDRLVRAEVAGNATVRRYDSRGRLLSETTHGSTITCRYDDLAGQVQKTWPDGRTELLSHDLNGVISSIAQTANGALGSGAGVLASFSPSGPGAFGSAQYRGGSTLTNHYDERKRLTAIVAERPAGLLGSVSYRYDTANLRRVEALAGTRPKTSYFEFDARRRLTLARDGFGVALPNAATQAEQDAAVAAVQLASAAASHIESWRYDASDARTEYAETSAATANYTYGSGHRLLSDGTAAYTHHADGVRSSDGRFQYDVDAFGRIAAVRSGAATLLELDYDALGRPSALREQGQAELRLHYLGGHVEQESSGGSPQRQLTLHPVTGVPIAYHNSSGTYYALVDGRFNLIGLLDVNANLVETYRYQPFGAPAIFDAAGASRANSAFGVQPVFGGQRYLANVGLYLSKRRLMDPRHGLFLAPDPKGYVDSPTLYAYAAQDPIDNIDPNGDIIPFIIAAFVIGGALAGAGYSIYDAYHNPSKYEGAGGALRVLGNVFAGAAIGGVAVVAGEAVLAAGGAGIFATGTGAASLTATQTFVLYGTSSAASGAVLRSGFNSLFPDYVNPVTPGSIAFDYVAGGGIAAGLRALAPVVSGGAPGSTVPLAPQSWGRFWADAGGEAAITGQLGPYPGKLGALLDRIGIRQGYSSSVVNHDIGGSWFARTDTAAHEGFHVFVARYFPTFRNLSSTAHIWGAAARYPEEVVAYALGHSAALRFHGVPLAPLEAFRSLAGYPQAQQTFAKAFWGTVWAGLISATAAGVAYGQTPPNEKLEGSK
jgi:RHS repeat-associated protein